MDHDSSECACPDGVVLTLAAAAAYAVPAAGAARLSERAARMALLAGMAAACGCVLAWGLLGEPPRFGFAPALSVTAWLVLTVYAVERQLFPQLEARWALAGLGVGRRAAGAGVPRLAAARERFAAGCLCTGRWASPRMACSPRR